VVLAEAGRTYGFDLNKPKRNLPTCTNDASDCEACWDSCALTYFTDQFYEFHGKMGEKSENYIQGRT